MTSALPPGLRAIVEAAIHEVAPDIDVERLPGDVDLREVTGMDSLDFVGLMEALQRMTGAVIPDHDYPRLATVDGCVAYLTERCGIDDADTAATT